MIVPFSPSRPNCMNIASSFHMLFGSYVYCAKNYEHKTYAVIIVPMQEGLQ